MTPLAFLTTARRHAATQRETVGGTTVLAARPAGVLHAYTGPLTPSGRRVPRAGRTACHAHTRPLGVVPLSEVGFRRVCLRCTARLTSSLPGEAGRPLARGHALALHADVTPFDLAVDLWRAETIDDIERVEWLTLLIVGYPACRTVPVIAPTGKQNPPLDELIANARARFNETRDPYAWCREEIDAAQAAARAAARTDRKQGWDDREARIARLGIVNATATG